MRRNVRDGTVHAPGWRTRRRRGAAVSNTGPAVRPDQIGRMLAPFGRLDGERIGHGEGFGLGLSIVSAIAEAHGAALTLSPRDGGGLDVEVRFPEHVAAAPPPEPVSHDPATLVPPPSARLRGRPTPGSSSESRSSSCRCRAESASRRCAPSSVSRRRTTR